MYHSCIDTRSCFSKHATEAFPLERPPHPFIDVRLDDCRSMRRVVLVLASKHARPNQDTLPAERVRARDVGRRVVSDHVHTAVERRIRLRVQIDSVVALASGLDRREEQLGGEIVRVPTGLASDLSDGRSMRGGQSGLRVPGVRLVTAIYPCVHGYL